MRRFAKMCLVAVAGGAAVIASPSGVRADNRAQVAVFRALTDESPTNTASHRVSEPEPQLAEPVAAAQRAPAEAMPQPTSPRVAQAMPTYVPPTAAPRMPVRLYSGVSARSTLNQFPRRAAVQTNPTRPIQRQSKPFQGPRIDHEPTLSPYLNLDRNEDEQAVPNYFTFVRPEVQQREMNRVQQREIQQLRGQIQTMTTVGAPPQFEAGRSVGAASPARFMDTAQFYSGGR